MEVGAVNVADSLALPYLRHGKEMRVVIRRGRHLCHHSVIMNGEGVQRPSIELLRGK
jgi:hypothetical protein